MKTILTPLVCLVVVAASPVSSRAATFFADYFTNSSTLNQPPAPPTTNSASYQTYLGSTNANSTPDLSAGRLTIVYPNTGAVLGEALARFSTNPVALSEAGDFIDIKIAFINTSNILSTADGSTTMNANATINIGLYNSGGVDPNQGQFATGTYNGLPGGIVGGVEDWLGYFARIGYSGNSSIITRPAQTPVHATASRNQDVLFSNASGTQAFGEPAGSGAGGPAGATTLVQGATNTLYLHISLSAPGTLVISNALFAGVGTGGTMMYSQQRTVSGANFLTSGFDAFAVGWRNNSTPGQGSAMSLVSVEIGGQSTVVTTPPDIISQPAAVTVPSGSTCAYYVVAQGFNMTYQWHRYGTNLLNGGNIAGATSDTLVISPATAADVASGANGYYVTITGTGGYSTNSVTNSLTLGTAKNLVWSGSGNIWDLNTSANWLDGANPATFNFGDTVRMDDTAAGGIRVITLTGKYLSASSVTVDSTLTYTFAAASSGSFAGPGQLIYRGSGQLTLANVNTYTGGTIISNAAAFLRLENYDGLGTGPVRLSKAGGQMQIVNAGSASVGIRGQVVVEDDFTVEVDGTGAFATVFLGNLSGTAGKTLTFTQPDLSTTNRYRVYGTATTMDANIVLNGAAVSPAQYAGTVLAPYNGSGLQLYNGVISGNGGVIQRDGGTTVLAGQNTYVGGTTPTTGIIGLGVDSTPTSGTVTSGPLGAGPLYLAPEAPNLTGSGTVLAWGGARTVANPVQYPSGTNNQTLIIGGTNNLNLTGEFALNGTDGTTTFTNRILQVNNTGLTTISGVVSGSGFGLTKSGSGVLVLSGNNTYSGQTVVTNGSLIVVGQLSTGPVTVTANAALGGSGTILGPVTILPSGYLDPGPPLTINNNLTLSGNMRVVVNKLSSPTSYRADVSGTLTNAGTGTVTVSQSGPALIPGDTFALFNKAVANGAALTVVGGGVNWTNKLAVDGTISVVSVIPTTPTNLNFAFSGNNLTLSWPPNYLGWLVQSNIGSVVSTNTWFPVPNSGTTTQLVITVNSARSNVFYRMVSP